MLYGIYGGATIVGLFQWPLIFGVVALLGQLPFSIRKDIRRPKEMKYGRRLKGPVFVTPKKFNKAIRGTGIGLKVNDSIRFWLNGDIISRGTESHIIFQFPFIFRICRRAMLRLARTWLFRSLAIIIMLVPARAQNATTHAFVWSSATGMQDLGSLGGSSYANGINNAGQVVGYYETPAGTDRAFLWAPASGMQDLGTLGGDFAIASGINAAGAVVGSSSNAAGEVHGFLWTAVSGMQDLGTMASGTFSDGVAINDLGEIAGSASPIGNIRVVAFRQAPHKKMYGLGTLGYRYSYGYAINATATVVGSSPLNKNLSPFHAFIRRKDSRLIDLGTLGGDESTALGISQTEQVVGWSSLFSGDYSPQPFLWTATSGMQALVTLGGPNSAAHAINSKSQIAGFSDLSQNVTHAVLWMAPNQVQDLGTLGGNYSIAQSINDLGQIVGTSTLQ